MSGCGLLGRESIVALASDHFRPRAEGCAALAVAGHIYHGPPELTLAASLENAATMDALLRSAARDSR